jgi:hypothetical protein
MRRDSGRREAKVLTEIAGSCRRAYMVLGRTDLRCGIPSLTMRLAELHGVDAFEEGVLWLFRGRSPRRVRALFRDEGAHVLLTISYDRGRGPRWDLDGWGLRELDRDELAAVLAGGRASA